MLIKNEDSFMYLLKHYFLKGDKEEFSKIMSIIFTNTNVDERIELSKKIYEIFDEVQNAR